MCPPLTPFYFCEFLEVTLELAPDVTEVQSIRPAAQECIHTVHLDPGTRRHAQRLPNNRSDRASREERSSPAALLWKNRFPQAAAPPSRSPSTGQSRLDGRSTLFGRATPDSSRPGSQNCRNGARRVVEKDREEKRASLRPV